MYWKKKNKQKKHLNPLFINEFKKKRKKLITEYKFLKLKNEKDIPSLYKPFCRKFQIYTVSFFYKKYKRIFFNFFKIKLTFGINFSSITKICQIFGINKRLKIIKFNISKMKKINRLINHLTFKKTLKDKIIKLRMFVINDLKNYVYIRYVNGYPVRGQRTHTNSKTRKRLMMTSLNNFS